MSAVQEDEGTKEARNQQLLAEDIDSILARAEVNPLFCMLDTPTNACDRVIGRLGLPYMHVSPLSNPLQAKVQRGPWHCY